MKKVIPTDSILVPDNAELKFHGMIFEVYQWQQPLFDGSEHTFEMLKRTDTVSVICVVDDKILVIDDEQPHMGKRKSFPGGRIDPEDASVEAAAQREVLEETGYTFDNWKLVQVRQPYRKLEWFVYVLLAWNVKDEVAPTPDAGEKILVEKHDFGTVKSLVVERVGYLAESIDLFEPTGSIQDLLALPEFSGQTVDR